ncbi:MAG: methylenetetrahydrofolate--tRNA-(uracil(54)-C(5))-methyltransferase (FADH(2)-oxidizing) TrmFO [Thermacetogeniaceae bacterium]
MATVIIIGGGLAGSEAAWQASRLGAEVILYEMRPVKQTPAHHTDLLAELVCSNSLRSNSLQNAVGLLKEEMRMAHSLIMECADKTAVPAGGALAVDRTAFAEAVTEAIMKNPRITLIREEVKELPEERPLVIASGPLTSPALAKSIAELTGEEYLSFYDAAAPLVTKESLNMEKLFAGSRYGKGDPAYLNAPMNKEEYLRFWEALVNAEVHEPHAFEKNLFFEGCLPIEVMARRGVDTMRYGPLKPVGLIDPRTGKEPYAVVQLRQDNREGTIYNMVGFQTQLKWGEQKRVFRMIPGLENAEFVRFGVMHKNTFIKGPKLLLPTLQMRLDPGIFCAGQFTGVEGYVESAATGLIAGINSARYALKKHPLTPPPETAHGALCWYVSTSASSDFQPMNITFGLFPQPSTRLPRRYKNKFLVENALKSWSKFLENLDSDSLQKPL